MNRYFLVWGLVLLALLPGQADRAGAQGSGGDSNFRSSISDSRLNDPIGDPQSTIENRKSASTTVTFTYDNAGRLTQANYGSKTIAYTYDNAGNLTQQTVAQGGLYLPVILK